MKFILGEKQEMSQVYQKDKVIPITNIKIGSCNIIQIKTIEKDGYNAVQIGYGFKRKVNKPKMGHLKKAFDFTKSASKNILNFRYLKEFRVDKVEFKPGDLLDINSFVVGDKIKISGISKGKGFQGVVKRHGFRCQPTTHGTKDQVRMSGSVGATGPAHVFKGTKMGGQMGNNKTTVSNLEIIEIDKDNSLIKVKGALPGHRNNLIAIKADGEMKIIERQKEVESPKVHPVK
ncbi:MAG: 50S ribosomal protein L3 [Xanthomonadaceae bacterium]|nr:50S ribosomal protein L3 [Rhodospirillaceae bacterium]NIA17801.1 50S ribosomal protein L3 [Xanthomonadaceae bacterium]